MESLVAANTEPQPYRCNLKTFSRNPPFTVTGLTGRTCSTSASRSGRRVSPPFLASRQERRIASRLGSGTPAAQRHMHEG